jgi:hypothetical protein
MQQPINISSDVTSVMVVLSSFLAIVIVAGVLVQDPPRPLQLVAASAEWTTTV